MGSKIPGGSMDSIKLCSQIMSIISNFNKFKAKGILDDAATTFMKLYSEKYPETIAPTPPSIFRCTTLDNADFEEKKIELLFENWPVALVGDGCSVNHKAGEILTNEFGLLSPTTRCSSHAASGSMRRLTTSKTMSVPEVVTFTAGLKPILKHFKLSGKSSALLNESLEIMEMKTFKLMTWSPTRMANLLDCSSRTVQILFPLCDMLTSTGIKEDHVSYFLSPMCLSILHIMADLEKKFVGQFLRKLDTNEATIFEVLKFSETFSNSMTDFQTPNFDIFINGLKEDGNGNIIFEKTEEDGSKNSITLNYTHRPNRRGGQSKLEIIKEEAYTVKNKIIENLIENVNNQSQLDTLIEFASAFDLQRKCGKETRLKYIRQLHTLYGQDYVHTVVGDTEENTLDDLTITIKYPAKLKCTEKELIDEFNSIWPLVTKQWLQLKDTNPSSTRITRLWIHILEEYAIEYPNIADLILLLFAVSPGTGPLERSFSKLAKICYKDRGCLSEATLEILYLLATLDINENDPALLQHTRKLLQKS